MKNIFFLLVLSFLMVSCEEEVQHGPSFSDPNPNDVEIRIRNKSWYQLDSMYLNTSGGDQFFNRVGKRSTTSSKAFKYSYPEMEIRFQIDGKRFIHVPVDYSSMQKVDNGQYELEINSVDTVNLLFTFILDEL